MLKINAAYIAFLIFVFSAQATTIYVPDDYTEIQDAIDNSVNGDTIIVRPGTYLENIDFKGKAITLVSESGPEVTVIDGRGSPKVVTFDSGEGLDSILDGFTITNGDDHTGPAGIICDFSSPTITNNIISKNTSGFLFFDGDGGGIWCSFSSAAITYNTIINNTATGSGGGIYCYESDPLITYNVIAGNTASEYGGGVYCEDMFINYIYLINNTITENTASQEGGGIYCHESYMYIVNTILWDNSAPTGPEIHPNTGGPIVEYSDVKGGWSGTGNINADPLFVDPANDDFHLQIGSPCIDAGDPDPYYNDPNGTRNDMGAYYYGQGDPQPDLMISSLSFDPTAVDPNSDVTITYTVENIGDASCGKSFAVAFYLSQDDIVDVADLFLIEDTAPDLNPGDTFTNTTPLTNIGDNPGNWYICGWADWMEAVGELNEDNNTYAAGHLTINSLWNDVTTISRSSGGQVIFDLQPGVGFERGQYFLLGSTSGTTPGVVLPGGNTLPLNKDDLFDYILKYFNYPTFDDFRGWFDLSGQMVATLNIQPGEIPGSWVGQFMHFSFTTEAPYDFQSNPVVVEIVP